MAIDYPDYSPLYLVKYGKLKTIGKKETVPAGQEKTLFSYLGKGHVYGGFIWIDNTLSSHKADNILYTIDGFLFGETLERLDLFGMDHPHCFPYFLRKFDDTNYVYGVAFTAGISFELSISIKYMNNCADQVDVEAFLVYAKLE